MGLARCDLTGPGPKGIGNGDDILQLLTMQLRRTGIEVGVV